MKLLTGLLLIGLFISCNLCPAGEVDFERAAVARAFATGDKELAQAVKTVIDKGFIKELLELKNKASSQPVAKASLLSIFDKNKAKKATKEWVVANHPDFMLTNIERVYKEDKFWVVQFTMNDFGGGSGSLGYGRMRVRTYVDPKTWEVDHDIAVN